LYFFDRFSLAFQNITVRQVDVGRKSSINQWKLLPTASFFGHPLDSTLRTKGENYPSDGQFHGRQEVPQLRPRAVQSATNSVIRFWPMVEMSRRGANGRSMYSLFIGEASPYSISIKERE
jgi:hypothetical protein